MVDLHRLRMTQTLVGILEGIAVDEQISARELAGLEAWLATHHQELRTPVFEDLRERLLHTLSSGTLDEKVHRDLLHLCRDFAAKHAAVHPSTSGAFARLQGMALGVLADGRVDDEELIRLREWLAEFESFREHFVFGAFFSTLDEILAGHRIDDQQRARVRELCEVFGAPPPPLDLPESFTPAPGLYDNDSDIGTKPPAPPQWDPLPSPGPTDFLAIDLETANDDPTSVCAMGLARVHQGEITEVGATFVNPPTPFDPRHVRIHSIRARDVRAAGDFEAHWPTVAPLLEGATVLAHNATFARRCIEGLMQQHGLELETPPHWVCSLRQARRAWPKAPRHNLATLAVHLGLTAPTHDPQAGAQACAQLALELCREAKVDHPRYLPDLR